MRNFKLDDQKIDRASGIHVVDKDRAASSKALSGWAPASASRVTAEGVGTVRNRNPSPRKDASRRRASCSARRERQRGGGRLLANSAS